MSVSNAASLIAALSKLYEFLSEHDWQGYVVGGFIRDWLLGRQTNDVDIAVKGDALSIANDVAQKLDGRFVPLDEANGIARVVIDQKRQWYFDFSSFEGDIESNLARRDFTIDAMAVELGQLKKGYQLKPIDPFNGRPDLENKIIRSVSEEIFADDAVRLLRAVRLASELDFVIEPSTETLIRRYSQSITSVAGERIREELLRLLSFPGALDHLRYLDKLGLLMALIPELAESKGVEQPTEHFWDVFGHSLQTVAAIEFLLRENTWQHGNEEILATAPWSTDIEAHFSQEVSSGSNRKVLLKLGGLLHDIAKPKTKSLDDTGRARFLGHAKEGAQMTASILERLRFSSREIDLVGKVVYHHLRPAQIANEGLPSQRAIYRYFRDTGDAGTDILFLALADYLASRGPAIRMDAWRSYCQLADYVLTEHGRQQIRVAPRQLIDGHDLMDNFGLSPGALIGELLAMVREAQASGDITTKEAALALVQRELSLREAQVPAQAPAVAEDRRPRCCER
jgi:poly(A) polymerase